MSRLNDVLGVEDGKYFTVENSERRFKLSHNKIHEYTSFGSLMIANDMHTLIWLIENSEKIKILSSKPKLSKQQLIAIKGRIAEGTPWALREISGDEICFYESKPHYEDRYATSMDIKLYDFLEVGEAVFLPDLIGGSENE